QSRTCTHDKVFKAGVFPVSVTFRRDGYGQFGFQVLEAVKAQVDVLSPYGGLGLTSVDTGKVDVSPCLTGFVDIDLPLVKATVVVQHGHHEFQRIVGLEEKALVALHRKAGTVCFAER